jgi:hypothetical protein
LEKLAFVFYLLEKLATRYFLYPFFGIPHDKFFFFLTLKLLVQMMLCIKDTNAFNEAVKVKGSEDFFVVFEEFYNFGLD